jgi:hypothetical protein
MSTPTPSSAPLKPLPIPEVTTYQSNLLPILVSIITLLNKLVVEVNALDAKTAP